MKSWFCITIVPVVCYSARIFTRSFTSRFNPPESYSNCLCWIFYCYNELKGRCKMKSSNGTKISHSVWVLAGLMLSGLLGRAGISLAAVDTWTYKADMPTARGFVSGCVIDGKIYVIGGFPTHYSVTSAVEMYDPTNDTWTKMANMPSARCAHATCALDGKIYVFGGTSPDPYSTAKKNVYVYDPQTDTWTQKADMPYANALCGIAVVDGTIYLIGGTLSASSPPVSTVMAYDPVTESWTQRADMPTARGFLSACAHRWKDLCYWRSSTELPGGLL